MYAQCRTLYAVHHTTAIYCTPYTVLLISTVRRTLYYCNLLYAVHCTPYTILLISNVLRSVYAVTPYYWSLLYAVHCTPYTILLQSTVRRTIDVYCTQYNIHRTMYIVLYGLCMYGYEWTYTYTNTNEILYKIWSLKTNKL